MFSSSSGNSVTGILARRNTPPSPFRRLQNHFNFSRAPSPPLTPTEELTVELLVLSTLQGHSIDAREKQILAEQVEALTRDEQDRLVKFITVDAAPSCMENNACKAFGCTPVDLNLYRMEDFGRACDDLLALWNRLSREIIPNLLTMLYPLKKNLPLFSPRAVVLSSFRDRVLLPLLRDCTHPIPQLESMLFSVSCDTEPDFAFDKVVAVLMGTAELPTPPSTPGCVVQKRRAKTLPNKKTVRFTTIASRKSATFSI